MSRDLSPEEQFHVNLGDFILFLQNLAGDLVKKGAKIDLEIITLASLAITIHKPETIVKRFIKYTHKYWDQMLNRDEKYIIEHSGEIFSGLPFEHLNIIRTLLESRDHREFPFVSEGDRNCLWEYLHSFVRLSIRILYCSSENYIEFKDINCVSEAKKWRISLR
jgi:hypothetical protein